AVYRSGTGAFKAGDYILFYGVPFKSLYAKKNIYWVFQGSQNGKKMASTDGSYSPGYQTKQFFNTVYHGEEDNTYWEVIPNGEGVDHWVWDTLSITDTTKSLTASIKNIYTIGDPFSMKINLRGKTTLAHHTRVSVNGTVVDDFQWSGQSELTRDIPYISPSLFINGNNTIAFEEVTDTGAAVDTVYINWFEIYYAAKYVAEDDRLKFKSEGSGGISYEIKNYSTSDIWAFDITDTTNVSKITNPHIEQQGNTYTLKFSNTVTSAKTYYALNLNKANTPVELNADEPSDLSSPRSNVDYIIITHDEFYDTIRSLADYRISKGLNVEIVKIQDIYDEFSYGLKDAHAIKDFLTYAYNNWYAGGHPTYVLLVGDASIDYRDDLGYYAQGRVDLVPTYLFQTETLGDTPTDNWFVCVNGSDPIPDMIIGRLCVKTLDDLTNIIEKIKKYEGGKAGPWCKNVILASDNGAPFEKVSDELAAMLPVGFIAEKVYLSTYDSVESSTDDLINKINAGSLITNYTGHGSVDNWAGEYLFHTPEDNNNDSRNDVDRLTNGDKLTLVMTLNCLNGFFPNFVDDYSLAEEFVRAQDKGAIACFAPTGLGFTSEHEVLANKIFTLIFIDGYNVAGSILYTGKINTYNELNSVDVVEMFTLFGDPATMLNVPSLSSSIKLLKPQNNAVLRRSSRYTFAWDDTEHNSLKYKMQFSPDPTFPESSTIIAPLYESNYITGTEYTPNIFIWTLVKLMGIRNENIYWRVAGYDDSNTLIEYSPSRSFTFVK
ncbi:MAG: C25 family cysteine peptidase, partial [Proteobacteria bacterium]|nr:C25 family cysteine peptidase [Pseudomonadota bacterium]